MAVPGNVTAQAPAILGTWKFDLKQGNKKQGPRTVICLLYTSDAADEL